MVADFRDILCGDKGPDVHQWARKKAANDGRTFNRANYAKDLTTDIITQLTIERDLQAQSTPEDKGEKGLFGILTASHKLSELSFKTGQGLRLLDRINFIRPLKT